MPIVIGQNDVAVVTESTNFFGRAIDGVMGGVLASENLTGREAQGAMLVAAFAGLVGGGIMTRKRVSEGKPPVWGFIC